jgi:hypothetical protein
MREKFVELVIDNRNKEIRKERKSKPQRRDRRKSKKAALRQRDTLIRRHAEQKVKDLYQPFPEQQRIHDALRPMCSGQIAMAITGRRFGKTTLAVNEVIDHAIEIPGSRNWYIAHTEKQAYRIAWREMLDWRVDKDMKRHPPYLPPELIEKKRIDLHTVKLHNGSLIEFLGTIHELPMLGAGLHFVVFDEFPGIPWSIWFDIVRPMLIDFRGNALFIGTVPDPIKHEISLDFIDMYEEILFKKIRTNNKAFNFTSFCNPHINHEETKRQIRDLKRKGRMNDAKRLYHGKYTREYGVAFPTFEYDRHTVEPIEIPKNWTRIMAIDPHPQKPTFALWAAIDPRNHYWFYREMEFSTGERALTIPEIAYDIVEIENHAKEKVHMRVIDPTFAKVEQAILGAKNVKDLFKDYGMWFMEADRRFDTYYHKVTDMLVEQPEPTFHIFRSCPGFIRQMKNATWDTWGSAKARSERGAKDKLKKIDDDFLDCSKYIINSPLRHIDMTQVNNYRADLNRRWAQRRFL